MPCTYYTSGEELSEARRTYKAREEASKKEIAKYKSLLDQHVAALDQLSEAVLANVESGIEFNKSYIAKIRSAQIVHRQMDLARIKHSFMDKHKRLVSQQVKKFSQIEAIQGTKARLAYRLSKETSVNKQKLLQSEIQRLESSSSILEKERERITQKEAELVKTLDVIRNVDVILPLEPQLGFSPDSV